MLPLFDTVLTQNVGSVIPSQWSYLRGGINGNIALVRKYYSNSASHIDNKHVMIRLMETMDITARMELKDVIQILTAKSSKLAASFKFVGESSLGSAMTGAFYGKNCTEFIVTYKQANYKPYLDEKKGKEWETWQPLYPLIHPKSDLTILVPPTGRSFSDESGVVVMALDIVLLGIQYWYFLKAGNTKNTEAKDAITFYTRCVLPNTLYKYVDIALLNQIYLKVVPQFRVNTTVKYTHPFRLNNYDSLRESIVNGLIERLSVQDKNFEHMLKSIPSFNLRDMQAELVLPNYGTSKQVDWVGYVSRIKILNLLALSSSKELLAKNEDIWGDLRRWYRGRNIEYALNTVLPYDAADEINRYTKDLTERFGFS